MPTKIKLNTANDSGAMYLVSQDGFLRTDVTANVFDLSLDATTIGYGMVDFTDTVAQDGRVTKLLLQITKKGDGHKNIGLFSLDISHTESCGYGGRSTFVDLGDRLVDAALQYWFAENFLHLKPLSLKILFTSTLNVKTGWIKGSAHVEPANLDVKNTQDFEFKIVGFKPDLRFSSP